MYNYIYGNHGNPMEVLPSTFLQRLHLPCHLQAQRGAEGMPRQVERSRGNNLANLARSSCAKMYGNVWVIMYNIYIHTL